MATAIIAAAPGPGDSREFYELILTRRFREEAFGEVETLFDLSQSLLQRIDGLAQLSHLGIRRPETPR